MNLLGLKNNNRLTLSKLNAQIRKLATQKKIPLTIVQTHSESKAVSIIHKKRRNYSHIILCPETWHINGFLIKETLLLISNCVYVLRMNEYIDSIFDQHKDKIEIISSDDYIDGYTSIFQHIK